MSTAEIEGLLRELAPRVLGAVVRRYGQFDLAEDAVQEALLAAATRWPAEGVPASPAGWLVTVATRRLTDLLRAERSRRLREEAWEPAPEVPDADDTLVLLLLCCHPALTPASQIALTLRAVGGLSTVEIARAFLVPESTMTRRISRAKQTIARSGLPFRPPTAPEWPARLAAVRHVLYLVFTEGYAATSGPRLHRADLAAEAIRLTRLLHRLVPGEPETAGLLALMLLTNARRPARTAPDGSLVPLAEQDRSRWDRDAIAEGVALVTGALSHGPAGPYQLQAAIAAVHDEARSYAETDWPQIVALYEVLMRTGGDNPVVAVNHAVAVAMADGPAVGLRLLAGLESDPRLAGDHRPVAVRAHLLERAGDPAGARAAYLAAARLTTNVPQQRYLHAAARRLGA
ncbi:RNA polymerase sigma factor [Amycolatopsis suaedae]|uniref:RNA polymerase sigma factor n=1 Tax=Amycolatopsis suaedae TaxID=2510978 RepID=A0A4Q7J188_9PSEU|nr:DUF6596 domain-containing protein [Amycolatopsis suaedae]RZQ60498.1 RNA polymerase sigma factor [Amycolatopsis suaedae]